MADIGLLFPIQSTSEDETRSLGRQFGMTLSKGDVVALVGDLGAGKTQFVKGVASCFGIMKTKFQAPRLPLFTSIWRLQAWPTLPVFRCTTWTYTD